MELASRRAQRSTNIWPGFVDALATLLMVLVFVLLVFVLGQFFLSEAITGRDTALRKLQDQVGELAQLLSLERKAKEELRLNIAQLSQQLQASVAVRDDLKAQIQVLTGRAEDSEKAVGRLSAALKDANATIAADKAKIADQLRQIADLAQDIEALKALKAELESKAAELAGRVEKSDKALIEERKISESARAQIALLNQQMSALRQQLAQLNAALEAAEKLAKEQEVQITSLGNRLNAALATKVHELQRYRSEFFGRLRDILGNQPGIRIVGDRFVFQSEVLFDTGSADLGPGGKEQLDRLATLLLDVSQRIPKDIDWILRIDGHTDRVPIHTDRFPSNWELSTARALSVVRYLIERGLPATRLAATGFGEFQPIDDRSDEIAYRRNRRIEMKLTER
jgi:chemotaxis protein MotB